MNQSRITFLVASVVAVLLSSSCLLRADDSAPPSLSDIHQVLQQAAGDSADTMPPADQQRELLGRALKMLRKVPHNYHGVLNHASRDIEDALNELSSGDTAHKARADILDASDLIKSVTDR